MTIGANHRSILFMLVLLSFTLYLPLILTDADRLAVGRFIGFVGLQLIWWQVILGSRQLMRYATEDLLWVNKKHQLSGTYGFLIILLHPLLIVSVYGLGLVWPPSFASTFDIGVRFGTLAMSVLAFIWFTSALLRGKLSWRWWKRLHIVAYVLFPILFFHMLLVGSSIQQFPWLEIWLYSMAAAFCAVLLLRIAGWAGLTKHRYQLLDASKVAKDVTRFRLRPMGRRLTPRAGQFAYLQAQRYGESHPFTVSHYDPDSGEISFSIKAVGPYSRRLTSLQPGDTVFIDGPYGVFTQELGQANRPTVVIAGGIGITPFVRHLEQRNIDYLFWSCRTEADIAYQDVIEKSGANINYTLSEQTKPGQEATFITVELLEKRLDQPLLTYDFYLCGPPPMMKSLHKQLSDHGIQPAHIYQEKFSL